MNRSNYNLLHLWRGLAAIFVLVFHLSANMAKEKYWGVSADGLREMFNFGGEAGVAFFFVLSGFLIMHVHWKDIGVSELYVQFVAKRIIRVYPAYIVVFVALWLSSQFAPSIAGEMKIDLVTFIKSILLIPQDKLVVGGTGAPIVVVAWSLQYEMMFYLLFSIAILSPRTLLVMFSCFAIFFAYSIYSEMKPNFFQRFFTHPMAWLFLLGCAAGVPKRRIFAKYWDVGQFVGGLVLFFLGCYFHKEINSQSGVIKTELIYGLASYMIISGGCKMEDRVGGIVLSSAFKTVGDASYSIYLTHFPVVAILCKMWVIFDPARQFNINMAFIVMAISAAIFGIVFHKKIEVRLLAYLNTKSKKYISN